MRNLTPALLVTSDSADKKISGFMLGRIQVIQSSEKKIRVILAANI